MASRTPKTMSLVNQRLGYFSHKTKTLSYCNLFLLYTNHIGTVVWSCRTRADSITQLVQCIVADE